MIRLPAPALHSRRDKKLPAPILQPRRGFNPKYLTLRRIQQTSSPPPGLRLCRELLAQTALAQFVASEYLAGSGRGASDSELL